MSAGWIAGNVRARLLLERRLGPEGVRALAACDSLGDAVELLDATAYGGAEHELVDLEDAQHAVAARTLLWLRTLAGWLPRGAVETVRALGAWFELVNVENRLAYLHGSELRTPFDVGALSTSWPRIARAQSPLELRETLRASPWGDPGSEDPATVHLALRVAWAQRVLGSVPEAGAWASGALALLLAREAANGGNAALGAPLAVPALGLQEATSIEALRATLPRASAWALTSGEEPRDLWRAEAAWWRVVERDAEALVRGPLGGRGIAVGVIALLGLDAVRVTAALAVAALGGDPVSWEALDALL